jgi:hypothetical protein
MPIKPALVPVTHRFPSAHHSGSICRAMLDSLLDAMTFFASPTRLVLYSNLNPDECALRLGNAIDRDDPALFSFSGYHGVKPFLGSVEDRNFRVFQRGYKNIPPVLSGAFLPEEHGTKVDGTFDLEITSKIALCLFSIFGAVVITPVVLYSLKEHTVPHWMAISFACVYFAGALLVPRIVRWNGRDQEREISNFLCVALEAGEDSSAFRPRSGS